MEERFLNLTFTDNLLNLIRKIETLKEIELTKHLNLMNVNKEQIKKIIKNNKKIPFKEIYEFCYKKIAIEIIENYICKEIDKELLLKQLKEYDKNNDYDLSEKVKIKLKDFFKIELQNKIENFSNGRMVRNIYDDLIMNHARRIINTEDITREKLSLITESDFNL